MAKKINKKMSNKIEKQKKKSFYLHSSIGPSFSATLNSISAVQNSGIRT